MRRDAEKLIDFATRNIDTDPWPSYASCTIRSASDSLTEVQAKRWKHVENL